MIRLHGYWRSTASYRVRIALNLEGVEYTNVLHDLRLGEQREPQYLTANPQGLVPMLEVSGQTITQSLAIMEWLEERHPRPALLPDGPLGRATTRSMASIICSDVHPLNNLRVLNALRADFGANDSQVNEWIAAWIHAGFAALEPLIAQHGRGFAFGSGPTLADCCLVPQIYSAERFGVSLEAYPRLRSAGELARDHPAFRDAHPDNQPDADRAT